MQNGFNVVGTMIGVHFEWWTGEENAAVDLVQIENQWIVQIEIGVQLFWQRGRNHVLAAQVPVDVEDLSQIHTKNRARFLKHNT